MRHSGACHTKSPELKAPCCAEREAWQYLSRYLDDLNHNLDMKRWHDWANYHYNRNAPLWEQYKSLRLEV
jgi:hypothetical protein